MTNDAKGKPKRSASHRPTMQAFAAPNIIRDEHRILREQKLISLIPALTDEQLQTLLTTVETF